MRKELVALIRIGRNWRYWLLFAVSLGIFYLINVFITNIRLILYAAQQQGIIASIQLIFTVIKTFHRSVLPSSIITLFIIGILVSVLICLLVYNYQRQKNALGKPTNFFMSIGIFLGFLAPGCVPCGIGLIGLFGFASAFATLPFQGKEISILAIGFLLFAIVRVSHTLSKPVTCALPSHADMNERRSLQ